MDTSSIEFRTLVKKINKEFYDLVFEDPWLKKIFRNVTQEHIEAQQTDFMVGAFGGPKVYSGRPPNTAHPHIYIDEKMWELREDFLKQAFKKLSVSEEIATKWIKIDEAFKARILKKSVEECEGRWKTDPVINERDPLNR